MSLKKILITLLLLDFTALSIFATYMSGVQGLITIATDTTNWWGPVTFIDTCIALSVALYWSWRDAREHGRSAWAATILAIGGSIGPLFYLATRPDERA